MYSKFAHIAWIAFVFAGTAAAAGSPIERGAGPAEDRVVNQGGPRTLKDPIELCDKLAGVEREICVRQAREKPGPSLPGVAGVPSAGGIPVGAVPGGPAAPASGSVPPAIKK